VKCSEGLSDLENARWVCNHPFEKTKPSKPFKSVKNEIDVEILGKKEETTN
jgi:hypothetical protein